jgi:hypothetical protein
MRTTRLACAIALTLAVAAPVPLSADTVVLGNGARLTGEVVVGPERLTVRSASGSVVLPLRRILKVEGESGGAVALPGRPARAVARSTEALTVEAGDADKSAAEEAPTPTPRASGGPPRVRDVLAQRIDIDFEGVAAEDVLVYIRELTGVNLALAPEVRLDATPVNLRLRDVRIEEVLELILEPRSLHYSIRPGEILYVYGGAGGEFVMRVYPVADLLVSTEDRYGGGDLTTGNGTGGGLGGGGTRGGGGGNTRGGGGAAFPQYQGVGTRSGAQLQGGRATAAGDQGISELGGRANALILLIKNTCGRGTWEDPAGAGVIEVDAGR